MGKKFDKWVEFADKWLNTIFIAMGVLSLLLVYIAVAILGVLGFFAALMLSVISLVLGYVVINLLLSMAANLIDIRKSVTNDDSEYEEDKFYDDTAEDYGEYKTSETDDGKLNFLDILNAEKEIAKEEDNQK